MARRRGAVAVAMLAEARNDLDEMETYLRRLIVIAPQSQHAYNALGYSLADRNIKLDEALQLIQKANELAPDDPYILDSLGWVKFRLGRHDEAEQVLRRAYELRADAEIAAQRRARADVAAGADEHVADQHGAGVNIGRRIDDRNDAVDGINTQGSHAGLISNGHPIL